jgi:hypothetical protein
MAKCPEWIFDILCSRVCILFLSSSHPLEMSSKHFCEELGKQYDAIDVKGPAEVAEQMVRFLSEVNAGEDAVLFLNDFIYYRMNYETKTKKRNLKPLFGNPEEGVSQAVHSDALKRFKAYVFGLRSNNSPTPPPAWDMVGNAESLPAVKSLVETSINPLDLL